MQFKMAENSLFAILMRSPWWASALVAAGIAALSFALLPSDYVIFGLAVALPFPVIAGIAAWRQWQAPSTTHIESVREAVAGMNWKAFAAALESAWRARGLEVERLDAADADFELTQGWRKTVVLARRWKVAQLGAEPIRALDRVRERREAQAAAVIVIGEISAAARKLALERKVELLDAKSLGALLTVVPKG